MKKQNRLLEVFQHLTRHIDINNDIHNTVEEQLKWHILALVDLLEDKQIITYKEWDDKLGYLVRQIGKAKEWGLSDDKGR